MANIKIKVDEPLIPDGVGFVHVSTSWQVAASRDFENDLIVESMEDPVNLLEYEIIEDLDVDQVVFVRIKINFSDSSTSEWSRIVTVSESQKGFKLSNTIIVTPKLNTIAALEDVDDIDVKITTGEFTLYAGSGDHESTDWFVETTSGVVLWERIADKDNLTEITIPNRVLTRDRFFVAKAIHNSTTNTASNPGRLIFGTGHSKLNKL